MPLNVVVSGATGRMGSALGRLIREADDLHALGGIAREAGPDRHAPDYPQLVEAPGAGALVRDADVVVDFSAPEQLRALVEAQAEALAGRALVIGTTGLDASLEEQIEELGANAAVLVAANFSVGVNVLLGLVERAARALDGGAYDIEIVEAHHRRKEDAPSGTALALGRAAAAGRGADLDGVRIDGRSGRTGSRPSGEIAFHSLRGGDVVGEHEVHFLGERERITLGHGAMSRDLFAEGALVAARWLAGKDPGRYGMKDVLGLG